MSEPAADAPAGDGTEQVTCAFPGCGEPPAPKKDPSKPGPAPKFCARPDHTAGHKWRAERSAKAGSKAGAVEEAVPDKPVTESAADAVNVREDVVRLIQQLDASLDRYVTLLQTVSDPEAAEAQVLAVESEANTRIAQADARADQERTRRINAEQAKEAAENGKNAADEAAEQMMGELAAARANFEAEVERVTAEASSQVEEARAEAQRQVVEARALAEKHVNAARQGAADEISEIRRRTAEEVQTAENAAGEARVKAERDIAAMTRTLEEAQAAAAAQVEEANRKAAAAEARANEAEENGRHALRNAEGMVQAAKNAADTVQAGLKAEIERTTDRLGKQEDRVDELRNELDEVRDKLRAAEERARTAEQALRGPKEQGDTE